MKSMEYKIAASTALLFFYSFHFLHRLIVLRDCVFIKCKFCESEDILFYSLLDPLYLEEYWGHRRYSINICETNVIQFNWL